MRCPNCNQPIQLERPRRACGCAGDWAGIPIFTVSLFRPTPLVQDARAFAHVTSETIIAVQERDGESIH